MVTKNKLLKPFAMLLSLSLVLSLAVSVTTVKKVNAATPATDATFFYGDQLTTQGKVDSKVVYDALRNIDPSITIIPSTSFTSQITRIYKLTAPATIAAGKVTLSPADDTAIGDMIYKITQPAVSALLFDRPDIFWLDTNNGIVQANYSIVSNAAGGTYNSGDPVTITITDLTPIFTTTSADAVAMNNTIMSSISTYPNTIAGIQSIHDYLAGMISYANLSLGDSIDYHSVVGSLINHVAVCEGYSKAFKLLCDRSGIPCILVSGSSINPNTGKSESHMWNYVNINNAWYAVDTTWDDQASGIKYDYFLVTNETISKTFGGTFLSTHTTNGDIAIGTCIFSFPSLSILTIPTQPATLNVQAGNIATFSVTPSITVPTPGTYAYQWQNSVDGGLTWNNISGATASSYTTAATTSPMNNNKFRCAVTFAQGGSQIINSTPATLTVGTVVLALTPATGTPFTGTVGTAFTGIIFVASNGTYPYNYTATNLPLGITVNPSTGALTGIPTSATSSPITFTVTARDSVGSTPVTNTYTLTINALPPLTMTPANNSPITGAVGTPFSGITFIASNGTPSYTYTAAGLPSGITVNPTTGVLTGTPTTATISPIPFTVKATDSKGTTITYNYTLNVSPLPPLTMTPANNSPITGAVGTPFTGITFIAYNGTPSYTYTASGLPSGITVNSTTGVLTGTPTSATPSPIPFTVKAVDSKGANVTYNYTLSISALPPLTITPASGASFTGTVGQAITSQTFVASNGVGPYTYSATGLPNGVTISSTGVLSGTPTVSGPFSFIITAKDNSNNNSTQFSYTFNVATALTLSPADNSVLAEGILGVAYSQTLTAAGGSSPYSFVNGTALPGGLSLNATSGLISGTPTASGTFPLSVTLTDSKGATVTHSYTIKIATVSLDVPSGPITPGTVGNAYSIQFTGKGGTPTYTYKLDSSGNLPNTFSIDLNTGKLTGSTTVAGNYTFSIIVADSAGNTNTIPYSLTIGNPNGPVIVVTAPSVPVITIDDPFVHLYSTGTNSTQGSNTTTAPKPKVIKDAIIYASDKTINVGDTFDYMKDVTAIDNAGKGKDITNKVTVSGEINTFKTGTYSMLYTVTGSNGHTVSKYVYISVQ